MAASLRRSEPQYGWVAARARTHVYLNVYHTVQGVFKTRSILKCATGGVTITPEMCNIPKRCPWGATSFENTLYTMQYTFVSATEAAVRAGGHRFWRSIRIACTL
eukprot:6824627-Pyramimonas_sp.AAC.1